jgi:hypothetical protein
LQAAGVTFVKRSLRRVAAHIPDCSTASMRKMCDGREPSPPRALYSSDGCVRSPMRVTSAPPGQIGSTIILGMRFLRTLFLLLLCAALPISGLAASGLTGECPMQMSMAADDSSAMSAPMPDCKAMQSPSSGKAKSVFCKATVQCQIGSLYHPVSVPVVLRPTGLFSPVVFHYVQSLSVREPAGLWRPPRAI